MTIHFVTCFAEIHCAQINCIPSFDKALDDLADSVNSVIAAHPFVKPNCLSSAERNNYAGTDPCKIF